jgi:ABC-2 type transport system ATP-binding protein
MNNPIISITNLSKSYKDHNVLNNLNWQVEQGDIVALLGKNGAGKSTLLESIMNLREINQGEIKLWDHTWDNLSQDNREKIGFVAQDNVGFEWMRVKDFLDYLGGFFNNYDAKYCAKIADGWGLDPKQKVADLSGGQKQIMHVIQALSIKPELLILDEPVAHLDPSMRRQFISELIELACELNSTVIFSSHIISDLERISNKVALIKKGQIQTYHDVEPLKAHIAYLKIHSEQALMQSEYYSELSNWQSHATGATATILSPLEQSLTEFIKNAPQQIEMTPMNLEDWYLEMNNESV